MGKAGKLATAYHNLSVTLEAGVSILRSLDIIADGLRGNLRKVFLGVRESIAKGEGVAESMKQYRRTFDAVDLMLVEAAEASGKYPECFKLLSSWYEFRIKIMRILKSGLIFPLLILHLALFLVPLPRLVLNQITFNGYLRQVFGILLVLYLSIFLLVYSYRIMRKARFLKYIFDTIVLMIPILGKAVWELSISRFAYAFNMLYKAGVPVTEALAHSTGLAGNLVVAKIFEGGTKSAQAGNSVCAGFSSRMPSEYRNLWEVGEETGEISKTVDKIAEIAGDRAEFYFSEFARWFPKIVYVMVCIWMISQIFRGYANLYSFEGF